MRPKAIELNPGVIINFCTDRNRGISQHVSNPCLTGWIPTPEPGLKTIGSGMMAYATARHKKSKPSSDQLLIPFVSI